MKKLGTDSKDYLKGKQGPMNERIKVLLPTSAENFLKYDIVL